MNQENQITDSWDEIDESELEQRLEKEKQERLRKDQEMASTANQNGISLLSNGSADEFRPRILQRERPSPKVTILRRPTDSSSQSSNSQQNVNKTQIKSLEQREKEYAEARLRILGSATDSSVSEDQVQTTRYNPQRPTQSSYCPPSVNSTQLVPNDNCMDENVVRLPRGPNGQGFNIRR